MFSPSKWMSLRRHCRESQRRIANESIHSHILLPNSTVIFHQGTMSRCLKYYFSVMYVRPTKGPFALYYTPGRGGAANDKGGRAGGPHRLSPYHPPSFSSSYLCPFYFGSHLYPLLCLALNLHQAHPPVTPFYGI